MDYRIFLETVVKGLKEFYGRDADVEVKDMLHNNGVHKDGLFITFIRNSEPVCPIIYLNSIFESFADGSRTMDECIGMIVSMRKEFAADGSISGMAERLLDWERVKGSVYPALISKSENRELLKRLAYTPFLDLAAVYIIRSGCSGTGAGASAKITHPMLDAYGVTKAELHRQAMSNLGNDGYAMEDMMDVLCRMVPEAGPVTPLRTSGLKAGRMYVFTNSSKFYGAAAMLDSRLLEQNLGSTTSFILPSSIHEMILVPVSGAVDADRLNGIIREVNDAELDVSERLSDHYYIYDGKSRSVKMCA